MVIIVGIVPLIIAGYILKSPTLYIVYCTLGLIIFSILLILDTMRIVKGKMIGFEALDLDEYIMGAMMLYVDIILIFVIILKILASINRD